MRVYKGVRLRAGKSVYSRRTVPGGGRRSPVILSALPGTSGTPCAYCSRPIDVEDLISYRDGAARHVVCP